MRIQKTPLVSGVRALPCDAHTDFPPPLVCPRTDPARSHWAGPSLSWPRGSALPTIGSPPDPLTHCGSVVGSLVDMSCGAADGR